MNKNIIPFNQDDIYAKLQEYALELGFTDALFAGSNTSFFLKLMAYAISINNANVALALNEFFITNAIKRSNILKAARLLGYEVKNRISYQYKIRLVAIPPKDISSDTTKFNIIIKKYTEFTDKNKKYYYLNDDFVLQNITKQKIDSDTLIYNSILNQKGYVTEDDLKSNGITTIFDIIVKEGELHRYYDENENPNGKKDLVFKMGKILDENNNLVDNYVINIPYQNVEENGIELYLSRYNKEGNFENKVLWTRRDIHYLDYGQDAFSKSYIVLRNFDFGNLSIYFKYCGIVDEPIFDSTVYLNVLTSSGSSGRALGKIDFVEKSDQAAIIPMSLTSGVNPSYIYFEEVVKGADEETDKQIKETAPIFHNIANRCVTAQDYEIIVKQSQYVEECSVWGGEELLNRKPGYVFLSFLPTKTSKAKEFIDVNGTATKFVRVFNENNKDEFFILKNNIEIVLDSLKNKKIMTIENIHKYPIFIDVDIKITLTKNIFKYPTQLAIANSLITKFLSEYEKFNKEIFESSILKIIFDIVGETNGLKVEMNKKISLNKFNIQQDEPYSSSIETKPKYIEFYLPIPFGGIYSENGVLDTSKLPKIDTENLFSRGNLVVDFSSWNNNMTFSLPFISFPIKFNNIICGSYTINNDINNKYIYIKLFVKSNDDIGNLGEYSNSPILESYFQEISNVKLNYILHYNDIKTIKNTTTRLNSIEITSL